MNADDFEGLSSDGQPITEVEEDGVLLRARVLIQCGGGVRDLDGNLLEPCGMVIPVDFAQLPEGECEIAAQCPKCSARVGVPVYIPVAILVGQDVANNIADGDDEYDGVGVHEDDGSQPFEGANVQEGIGPLSLVTTDGTKIG